MSSFDALIRVVVETDEALQRVKAEAYAVKERECDAEEAHRTAKLDLDKAIRAETSARMMVARPAEWVA